MSGGRHMTDTSISTAQDTFHNRNTYSIRARNTQCTALASCTPVHTPTCYGLSLGSAALLSITATASFGSFHLIFIASWVHSAMGCTLCDPLPVKTLCFLHRSKVKILKNWLTALENVIINTLKTLLWCCDLLPANTKKYLRSLKSICKTN